MQEQYKHRQQVSMDWSEPKQRPQLEALSPIKAKHLEFDQFSMTQEKNNIRKHGMQSGRNNLAFQNAYWRQQDSKVLKNRAQGASPVTQGKMPLFGKIGVQQSLNSMTNQSQSMNSTIGSNQMNLVNSNYSGSPEKIENPKTRHLKDANNQMVHLQGLGRAAVNERRALNMRLHAQKYGGGGRTNQDNQIQDSRWESIAHDNMRLASQGQSSHERIGNLYYSQPGTLTGS